MTSHLNIPGRPPKLTVDVPAILARHRDITSASTTPDRHAALLDSATDVPLLVAELERVWIQLLRLRLQHANLRAAARAALAAHRDGETDPFGYLVDELTGIWPTAGPSIVDER